MATITVTADGADRMTLSERIVAAQLGDQHYVTQLIERLAWATDDAEPIESRARRGVAHDLDPDARLTRTATTIKPRREARTGRAHTRGSLRPQITNPS
jgi:hypothetical protein